MMTDTSARPDDPPLASADGPDDGPEDVSHWWIDLGGMDCTAPTGRGPSPGPSSDRPSPRPARPLAGPPLQIPRAVLAPLAPLSEPASAEPRDQLGDRGGIGCRRPFLLGDPLGRRAGWEPAELGTGRTMPPRSTAGDAGSLGTLLGSCRRGWLPTAPAFGTDHPASMPIRSASPFLPYFATRRRRFRMSSTNSAGAPGFGSDVVPVPPSAAVPGPVRPPPGSFPLASARPTLGCPARRRPVRFRPNAIAPAGPLGPAPGRAGAGIDCCYHRRGRHRRVGVLLVQEPAEGRLERRAGDLALPGRPVDRRLDVPAPGRPLLARQRVAPGGPRPCPRHVPLGVVAAEDVRNRSHRRARPGCPSP